MRGMSLPINTIVILAIAALVLVVVAALFTGVLVPGGQGLKLADAIRDGCSKFRTIYNCDITKMRDVTVQYKDLGDSALKDYTLIQLCTLANYKTTGTHRAGDLNECAAKCDCPVRQ